MGEWRRLRLFGGVSLALVAASPMAHAAGGTTERVSVSSFGQQANRASYSVDISADGQFVVFVSKSVTLVANDVNRVRQDVFLRNRSTGKTTLVDVNSKGEQARAGESTEPSISADGRFVCFASTAVNLVPGDNNKYSDVFLRDLHAGTTQRVSTGFKRAQANGNSYRCAVSGDGQKVAFLSNANNLVAGGTFKANKLIVHDVASGKNTLIGEKCCDGPAFSDDGRFLAYEKETVSPGGETRFDIYVRDLKAKTDHLVTVGADPARPNNSYGAAISADGRFVAFNSDASGLAPGKTNGKAAAYVRDLKSNVTTRVSRAINGGPANDDVLVDDISGDGRYVVLASLATNVIPGDTNGATDVLLYDQVAKTTARVSVGSTGAQANGFSGVSAAASKDGGVIAFTSGATNLVTGDTNGQDDVFVRTRN